MGRIIHALLSICLVSALPSPAQPTGVRKDNDPAVALAREISASVSRLRELSWKREVDIASYSMDELRAFVVKMLDAEMTSVEAERISRAWRVLGLVPSDYDLKKGMTEVLVEQVGGFYDPDARQLRVVDRTSAVDDPAAAMVERLGMTVSGMDRTIMAHELVHALQDQHFDLSRFPLDRKDNDDLAVAVSSLVEGDATITMMGALLPDAKADTVFKMARRLSVMVKVTGDLSSLAQGGMKSFKQAPEVLKQRMMFPYIGGLRFCLEAGKDTGYAGINAAFASPPVSTEQVLHPEKLLGVAKDWPTILELAPALQVFGDGWTSGYHNVLGELFTRVLLQPAVGKRTARKAAAGWDGDRYRLYSKNGVPDCVTWLTTWDTEDDAKEFAAAASNWLTKRSAVADEDTDWSDMMRRHADGTCDAMVRRGLDVALVLKAPVARAQDILGAALVAKRSEMKGMPERTGR